MKNPCRSMSFSRRSNMDDTFRIKTPATKYIKKIRQKKLKQLYQEAFTAVLQDPYTAGDMKRGDLAGIFVYSCSFQKTEHRVAYVIEEETVVFLLAGTHENFYQELKRS